MNDAVLSERVDTLSDSRPDLLAFIGAFGVGLAAYASLTLLFFQQWVITGTVILIMVTYAIVVARIPRLRVRLDQAGDNAYYLGLLFTLISMAVALTEVRYATTDDPAGVGEKIAVEQIIAGFGVALGSTITGIFLRVILHQMRVDPADVESMTRIELSEAAKRLRASLDSAAGDVGRFHDEMRQRTTDAATILVDEIGRSVAQLGERLVGATQTMVDSAIGANKAVVEQAAELTKILNSTASEASAAGERLRAIEPPPLTLSRRLEKVGKVLEGIGAQAERLATQMDGTAAAAGKTVEQISNASSILTGLGDDVARRQAETASKMAATVERVGTALDDVGKRLKTDHDLLAELEAQSRRSAEESARAQDAAAEVLTKLTELARGLTTLLNSPR